MNVILIILALIALIGCNEICQKLDEYCSCDSKCAMYGDCCPAHEHFGKIGSINQISACKFFTHKPSRAIWVVNQCRDQNHYLKDFCSKSKTDSNPIIKLFIPTVSKSGIIYENAYCALCNGEIESLRYVHVNIKCHFKWNATKLKQNQIPLRILKSCQIVPFFNDIPQRPCIKNLIRSCPKGGNETLISKCQRGEIHILTDGRDKFRNKFCCECWNTTCYRIFPEPFLKDRFSYTLDFNEWEQDGQDKSNSTGKFDTIDTLVYHFSFVFTCISIAALSILILIYSINEVFYNFGGYLTMSLCGGLLLTHFLTLLVTSWSITHSSFCTSIAIMQHFVNISTFIWMSLYALDLLQTFGFRNPSRRKKSFKTFLVYCLVNFIGTSILVGASSIIELTLHRNYTIRPHYGGRHCWFTNKIGGILWYFLPICLLLFWNAIACTLVFYRLIKSTKNSKRAGRNEMRSTLWLCIRLTAIFGMGYIFQIINILSHVHVLIQLGSLINCLQGFMLTICFMCTKRVHATVSKRISILSNSVFKSSEASSQTKSSPVYIKTFSTDSTKT